MVTVECCIDNFCCVEQDMIVLSVRMLIQSVLWSGTWLKVMQHSVSACLRVFTASFRVQQVPLYIGYNRLQI